MVKTWVRLGVVLVAAAAAAALVLRVAPQQAPVRDGNPADYWFGACRVEIGDEPRKSVVGGYGPWDGWLVYAVQEFHGQRLYRLRPAEALAAFPRVRERLDAGEPGEPWPHVQVGYRAWRAADPEGADPLTLAAKVRAAALERDREADPEMYAYRAAQEPDAAEHWRRASRYPLTVAAECVFLAGMTLFAAWPWLTRRGRLGWALHLGLLPPLLFLPFWLGYAPWTFTSAPSGGVLYPWLLWQFPAPPWTPLDAALARQFPQPLEPLSQTPGPMMVLSRRSMPGPVAVAGIGLALGLTVFWLGGLPARDAAARQARRARAVGTGQDAPTPRRPE